MTELQAMRRIRGRAGHGLLGRAGGACVAIGLLGDLADAAASAGSENAIAGFLFPPVGWLLLVIAAVGIIAASAAAARRRRVERIMGEQTSSLAKSESQLRTLIDALPDLVWLKDADGRYLACNRRFEEFFGATEAEIAGQTDFDYVPRDLARMFRENDARAIARRASVSNEELIRFAADGHSEMLETIKTPIFAEDGALIGVLGIGRDITARKNAEEALRASEEQYRRLFESASEACIVFDLEGQVVDANSSACRMYGYRRSEFLTLSGLDLLHPESYPKFKAYLREAAEIGRFETDSVDIRSDGRLIRTHVRGSRVRYGGQARLLAVVRDVTEQTNLAEERERSRAALNAMVESMPVGVALIGRDQRRHIEPLLRH